MMTQALMSSCPLPRSRTRLRELHVPVKAAQFPLTKVCMTYHVRAVGLTPEPFCAGLTLVFAL